MLGRASKMPLIDAISAYNKAESLPDVFCIKQIHRLIDGNSRISELLFEGDLLYRN